MKVSRPTWYLKNPCPVCKQYRALVLLTCPACTRIIAVCDEEGTVCPDPKDLTRLTASASMSSETNPCPHCGEEVQFDLATDVQIQAAGLTVDDYE